jgi:hypothetical protein
MRDCAESRATRAGVQAYQSSSVLDLYEEVPRAMDHHSLGCFTYEKFPTFASGRLGRGPVRFLGFHNQFHLTRPRAVGLEESPAYGDGSALASWIRLACDNRARALPLSGFRVFPAFPEASKGEGPSVFHVTDLNQFSLGFPGPIAKCRQETPEHWPSR